MNKSMKSVIVLTIICIVVGALLAVTNYVTAPIITEANRKKALESCFVVMKEATDFEEVNIEELEVPSTITNMIFLRAMPFTRFSECKRNFVVICWFVNFFTLFPKNNITVIKIPQIIIIQK